MKLSKIAILIGGTACAVSALASQDDARRAVLAAEALTTTIIYQTSVYTVIKCATDVTNCPETGTETLTSVVAVTTTICPASMTPGPITQSTLTDSSEGATSISSSELGTPTSTSISGALPTSPVTHSVPSILPPSPFTSISIPLATANSTDAVQSNSATPVSSQSSVSTPDARTSSTYTDAVPTSVGSSSNGYVPPEASSAGPTSILPSTYTDAVPTSFGSSSTHIPLNGSTGIPSSMLPTTGTFTDAVPTSFGSSSGYAPPETISTLPSSIDATTNTDAVPTSYGSSLSVNPTPTNSSIGATTNTDSVPTSVGSSSGAYDGPASSSSNLPGSVTSLTNAVPTLLPTPSPSGPGGNSSIVEGTIQITSILTQTFTSVISASTPLSSTFTGSSGVVSGLPSTDQTSVSTGPAAISGYNSTVVESTVQATSVPTQTWTSVVTASPSESPSTTIQDVPTSIGTGISGAPSGSGYPISSGSGNQTVISPMPTYSMPPINMGQVVGAGKGSLVAIIVALVFAHLA